MHWGLFVPSEDIGLIPQTFLMAVYGYILFTASNIISDGSEMLLCIYGPGIVGGLLIPILGAVPDGAIILVSGLGGGTDEEIQQQLSVGVGTLAGSTVMLLTIPWALGLWYGRRDRDPETGEAAVYTDSKGRVRPKLTKFSWTDNVITTSESVPVFAKMMMVSSLSYLIIQTPAFFYKKDKKASSEEEPFALAGFIVTSLAFVAYSLYQLFDARQEDHVLQKQRQAERAKWKESLAGRFSHVTAFSRVFASFDEDKNGYLDRKELTAALKSLGLNASRVEVSEILESMDQNQDGKVDEYEFTTIITEWIEANGSREVQRRSRRNSLANSETDAARAASVHENKARVDSDDDGPSSPKEEDNLANALGRALEGHAITVTADNEMQTPFLSKEEQDEVPGESSGGNGDDDEEEEEEEEYHELVGFLFSVFFFAFLFAFFAFFSLFLSLFSP